MEESALNRNAAGEHYLRILEKAARIANPRLYLEIGVQTGRSLAVMPHYARCIGVDPDPKISLPLPSSASILKATSDEFFAKHAKSLGGRLFDMAFIDGMHLAEFALRDFCNTEILCHERSLILIHDSIPRDEETSRRDRSTVFWTGDVWKSIIVLRRERPDLRIITLDAAPSGLSVILGAKAKSPEAEKLRANLEKISEEMMKMPFSSLEKNRRHLGIIPAREGLAGIEAFLRSAPGEAAPSA